MTRYKLRICVSTAPEKYINNGILPHWFNFITSIGLDITHPRFIEVRDNRLLFEHNARFDRDRDYLSFKTEADALAFKLKF